MPGFDKTGPQGKGPVTGGGRGTCRQNDQAGGGQGRGGGRGRKQGAGKGGGRGMGQGQRQRFAADEAQVNEQVKSGRNDGDTTTEE